MTFREWLKTATKKDGTTLSDSTVNHYADGFNVTSNEMYEAKVISKKLEDMELYELDLAIAIIFKNEQFIAKNKKGNSMYSNALKRYRCYKYLNTDLGIQDTIQEELVKKDTTLESTEKEQIIKARRGQGIYRELLMKKYNNSCVITNISLSQVLIASHIKPWAVCDNSEKIDVNNGLLLSATYDKLFDSGLITIESNGKMRMSNLINEQNAKLLNLKNGTCYNIIYNDNMKKYLDYHNKYIFVG